jgi:hypothetical protein
MMCIPKSFLNRPFLLLLVSICTSSVLAQSPGSSSLVSDVDKGGGVTASPASPEAPGFDKSFRDWPWGPAFRLLALGSI